MVGTQDWIIPLAEQRKVAENAKARITELDASHVSMISQPDAVAEVIEKALRAVTEPVNA